MTFPLTAVVKRWRGAAFTLIELIVSMTILSIIVLMVASLAGVANRAWSNGNQSSEVYQNGRAILDLIARDLRFAAISPKLQFIQSPSLGGAGQLTYSSNIFWQANIGSTSKGSLCEVGYYLTDQCELKRFFVPPDDTANYAIFNTPPSNSFASYQSVAPWVTNYLAGTNATTKQPLATVVCNGVLGFWVRCLDVNGDPIPYVSNSIEYNSADEFQPAVPGVRSPGASQAQNPTSFKYTDHATTAAANLLPSAVELYVLTVDKPTYDRVKTRLDADPSGQSAVNGNVSSGAPPMGLPGNVVGHSDYLRTTYGVKSDRVFYTRVQVGAN